MSDSKTYTQMRNEFQNKLFTQIFPKIRHFEEERKSKKIIAIIGTILFTIPGLFFLAIAIICIDSRMTYDVCLTIAVLLLGGAMSTIPFVKKHFENKIKEKIMPLICSCFDNISWQQGSPECMVDMEPDINDIIYDSKLIMFDKSKYDDVFVGIHNDVKYGILEGEFSRVVNTRKGKSNERVFNGVVIKLKMNKNFSGNTVIDQSKFAQIFQYVGFDKSGLTKTSLEDVEFNKMYEVYTDDEVEARYLITPSFMQRLKAMKVAFNANKVRCSFYKNYLLVGLFTSKDLFSICSLFKPIDDPKQFFAMYEEIVSIIKLIDHFKLDQKIGM